MCKISSVLFTNVVLISLGHSTDKGLLKKPENTSQQQVTLPRRIEGGPRQHKGEYQHSYRRSDWLNLRNNQKSLKIQTHVAQHYAKGSHELSNKRQKSKNLPLLNDRFREFLECNPKDLRAFIKRFHELGELDNKGYLKDFNLETPFRWMS